MLKMPLEDFLEEMKGEIVSYEELGEEKALEWEQRFLEMIDKNTLEKKMIKENAGKQVIMLKDEAELFALADSYWAAVENGEEENYWDGLK